MSAKELATENNGYLPEKVDSVVVGKDILDLLAGAMYVDPLNVYREYIQNAADAIDEAMDAGILQEEGQVKIWIDLPKRNVVIRDNGIGIPRNAFSKLLTNIGASHKLGKKLRGFRGVGRLSGLGYCQELIFRSRSQSDDCVYEMRWDGKALRNLLRDPSFTGGLAEAVQSIVNINELPPEGFPQHFFEVEMNKISRLKNDILLNEERVRDYLAQVAPVPFSASFSHGEAIEKFLESHGIRAPINIILNDDDTPITHKLADQITGRNGATEQIHGIKFVECPGFDGETAAVGWVCGHAYSGAIPRSTGLGGIRLKTGNIQVGEDSLLAGLFPEARFNSWAIGEIHVISSKVLPNGRRDDFEPSVHYAHLQGEFALLAKSVTHQIRDSSLYRHHIIKCEQQFQELKHWAELLSDQNLPQLLKEVLFNFTMDKLHRTNASIRKLKDKTQSDNQAYLRARELEAAVDQISIDNTLASKADTLQSPLLQAIAKVIIESAKTPQDGISLVLKVFEVTQEFEA